MDLINDGWRAAGLLIHPSSLPGPYGIGDLGPSAGRLAGFLKKAGLHFWQVLPLVPTSPSLGNSPYSAFSAFAGNPLLISPDLMVRDGWLAENEAFRARVAPAAQVDFEKVIPAKNALIDLAFDRTADEGRLEIHAAFQEFAWNNAGWLNDFALFAAAKKHFQGMPWNLWPAPLAWREEAALKEWGLMLARPILREKFAQYLFFSQLRELRELMHDEGLQLIGDAAIYVNHDSCDVWSQPWLFQLDNSGRPLAVAGVPPDYFSKDGQLWGNPLFNWPAHSRTGFDWWKHRLWRLLDLHDWVRLDHFRAFAACWEVPAGAETAACGRWSPGPGAEFFQAASATRPLNLIAEDLGIITPDVTELRRRFGYPGMRVLQFAFGSEMPLCAHVPYRIEPDNVVYSATHDNNTSRGWFRSETDALVRRQLSELAGCEVREDNAARTLIRLAWLSPGALALAPMQDILNLGPEARLNTPGTAVGNWGWKMTDFEPLTERLADDLAELGALSGRGNFSHPNLLTY